MKKTVLTGRTLATKRMVTCAILTALSVVFMLIGAITEVLDLVMFVLSCLCIIFAVIEIGYRHAFLIWGATGILCLLLLPSKTAAVIYCLGGSYPIFKAYFEKLHPAFAWILKFSFFNTMLILFLLVAQKILGLSGAGYEFAFLEFGLGNFVFLLYDFYLTTCIRIYVFRLRKRLKIQSMRD